MDQIVDDAAPWLLQYILEPAPPRNVSLRTAFTVNSGSESTQIRANKQAGLPPAFVRRVCMNSLFPENHEQVNSTNVLTGLDYMQDLEYTRKGVLYQTMVELGLDQRNWRTIIRSQPEILDWLEKRQDEESRIQALKDRFFIRIRVKVLLDQIWSPSFYKPHALALLNTLLPAHCLRPGDTAHGTSLHEYRAHFYAAIVARQNAPANAFPKQPSPRRDPQQQWRRTRRTMLKYFDLAISMIDSDRPVPAMKGVGSYLQILPTLSKRRIPSEDEDISSLHTQKQWDNSIYCASKNAVIRPLVLRSATNSFASMSQASAAHSFSSLQHSDNTSQASLSSGVTSADLTFLLHDPQETQRPDSAALTQNLANSSTFCEQGSIDFPEKAKVAEQLASSSKTSSLIAESLMDSRHLMPPSMIPARRSCKTSQGPGMDVETRQTEDDDQWNSYLHSLSRTYLGGCSDNVIVARQKAVGSREVVSSAENVENAVPQHQDADRTSDKPTTLTPTEGASSTQAPCLNVKKSGPDYTSRKKWLGSLLRQRVVFRTSNKRTLIKAGHVRKNTVAVNHVDHDIYDALAEHHVVDIVHALQVEDASLDRYRLTSFESPRQAPKPPGK